MRRPHSAYDRYRRRLAMAGAVIALAITACGSPAASASTPTPGPVTAESVRAALDNSTMQNAHFTIHGTLIKQRVYYPVSGEGILQLSPSEALQMTIRVQTYGAGVLRLQEVTIGGYIYTRLGTGHWTSKATTDSPIGFNSYVGEEIVSGAALWHARATSGTSTFDVWVRETDGYIVQIVYASKSGHFTMTFDSYNQSHEIAVPKN